MDFLNFFKKSKKDSGTKTSEPGTKTSETGATATNNGTKALGATTNPVPAQMSTADARELIRKCKAPAGLTVNGMLNLKVSLELKYLPENLTCDSLDLTGCKNLEFIPASLKVKRLILDGCSKLTTLPQGLTCYEIRMRECHWQEWPVNIDVRFKLDLQNSPALVHLPEGIKVGNLILSGAQNLISIGEDLEVNSLNLTDCTSLEKLPARGTIEHGRLIARNCQILKAIPSWVKNVSFLDIRNCPNIKELPESLGVHSRIDLANSGLQSLPASTKNAMIFWNGVLIDERIAFHPEELTATEIVNTQNVEVRRVMIERFGLENFMRKLSPKLLDKDKDPGGERTLLKVLIEGDEDLVCVTFSCPSTARKYVVRVPPTMKTCHEAVAWIAGFDNPNEYVPVVET